MSSQTKKSRQNQSTKDRNQVARQKAKIQEVMNSPVNKYLNASDDGKNLKYKMAQKLGQYFEDNPDPILDDVRQINALVHEVRHHKQVAAKAFMQYEDEGAEITLRDKFGRVLERQEVYSSYIVESQSVHIVLSKIREVLIHKLLGKMDGERFTFEHYDEYAQQVEKVIKELGYDLIPVRVELMKPM